MMKQKGGSDLLIPFCPLGLISPVVLVESTIFLFLVFLFDFTEKDATCTAFTSNSRVRKSKKLESKN